MVSRPLAASMAVFTCLLATPTGPCGAAAPLAEKLQKRRRACSTHAGMERAHNEDNFQGFPLHGPGGRPRTFSRPQKKLGIQPPKTSSGPQSVTASKKGKKKPMRWLRYVAQGHALWGGAGPTCSAVSSWKCVAKSVGQPSADMRCSLMAQARPKPSYVLVPRPSSSMMTSERALAPCAAQSY